MCGDNNYFSWSLHSIEMMMMPFLSIYILICTLSFPTFVYERDTTMTVY